MNDDDDVLPPTVAAIDDPRAPQATWTMLPVDTRNGECSQCGRIHDPDQPHDNQSLAYQYSYYAEHGRWPTWASAMEHCSPEVQTMWRAALRERGVVFPDERQCPGCLDWLDPEDDFAAGAEVCTMCAKGST